MKNFIPSIFSFHVRVETGYNNAHLRAID